jgi:hypothetical protein
MDTVPLRGTTTESYTSTKATVGILLGTPDTMVGGGGPKNDRVTQWSRSLVVALELHAAHVPCVPDLDHMPAGQDKHSVLFEFANVPALQLGQRVMVSGVEDVPELHLEQSCALDARGAKNS